MSANGYFKEMGIYFFKSHISKTFFYVGSGPLGPSGPGGRLGDPTMGENGHPVNPRLSINVLRRIYLGVLPEKSL